ncbi:MAG: HAMP domain-containing histidine kinase [Rhodospirillaceae bacterium]|nr:HAMP domain-containing histidine kinase [Rhodospirillaceae bacterium]
MARFGRLVKTTTFRFALLYTAVFAGSVGALFVFVFINTSVFAEQQTEAAIEAEVKGFQDTFRREGVGGLVNAIDRRIDPNTRTDGIYILTNPNQQRIAGNLTAWPDDIRADDLWINFSIVDLQAAEPGLADVRGLQFLIPGGYRLMVGRDIREARAFRSQLLRSLNIGLGITVALGVLGGLLFSRSIMGRVEKITQTCRRIMRGDLSQRIDSTGQSDELSRLSASVNEMLDQIERLMNGMREVSDNVAHDLRTPLNRLRVRLEIAANSATDEKEKEELEEAIADADGLLATFSSLLRIARAEASLRRSFGSLDLGLIVEDVVDLYQPLAEEKGVEFSSTIDFSVKGWGDPNLVAQALANLADNAVKYTPSGGRVSISVKDESGSATMEIADSGPGIPTSHHGKVFERLYRLDNSRSTPGSGLGLSLVRAVARSHGLSVTLSDNAPGLAVSVVFPSPPGPVSSDETKPL